MTVTTPANVTPETVREVTSKGMKFGRDYTKDRDILEVVTYEGNAAKVRFVDEPETVYRYRLFELWSCLTEVTEQS